MLPFILPPIDDGIINPIWNGSEFRIGSVSLPILEYSSNMKGWNDELTAFSEETAGPNHPVDFASRQHAISQINEYVTNPTPVILEIGCSSGYMLKDLFLAKPKATLLGADIVYHPLVNLAQKLPTVPLLRFDLLNCPLPDNSIDVVILLNVLEHIEDDDKALLQIKRILKPNGIAIIEVPAGPHLYDNYDKVLLHYRRYQMNGLCNKLLNDFKFKILKKSHLGFFIYPFFYLSKRRNQRLVKEGESISKKLVEKNIQMSSHKFLHYLMKLELLLGNKYSYPFGVRCLLTCQKNNH